MVRPARSTPVADPGEGPGEHAPPYFSTKMRPEGPKNCFWRQSAPPYLRVWMTDPPPLIWRSGSATALVQDEKKQRMHGRWFRQSELFYWLLAWLAWAKGSMFSSYKRSLKLTKLDLSTRDNVSPYKQGLKIIKQDIVIVFLTITSAAVKPST